MNYAHVRQSYQKIAAETVTPGQRILMLFSGTIGFLERALVAFQLQDPLEYNQTINNNIQRAQAIVRELNGVLDMEAGGSFSENMGRLYDYLDRRLQESNIRKRKEGIQEALKLITILRDAWAEMLRQEEASAAPPLEAGTTHAGGPS